MSGIDAYFTRLAKPAEPAPKRKVGRPSKKAELAAAAEKRAALEEVWRRSSGRRHVKSFATSSSSRTSRQRARGRSAMQDT